MQINVFEGARRISVALGVLWVGGFLVAAMMSNPFVNITYSIPTFGAKPVKVDDCPTVAEPMYEWVTTSLGDSVRLELCLGTMPSDDGTRMLVPYARAEGGQVWLGAKYSNEVRNYTKQLAEALHLSGDIAAEVESLKWKKRIAEWRDYGAVMLGGLLAGWVFVSAIGWVVRGFLGIPRGKDVRND